MSEPKLEYTNISPCEEISLIFINEIKLIHLTELQAPIVFLKCIKRNVKFR